MQPVTAVIIATKNRSEALERYALKSLEKSDYSDFMAIIWDASDDESSRVVAEKDWPYPIQYFRAPRRGSASQRNDAVAYALKKWHSIHYVVFIDDDSALSCDALGGVAETLSREDVWGVNIPMVSMQKSVKRKFCLFKNRRRRVLLPFLYHSASFPEEQAGEEVEWTGGGGMGLRAELFRDCGLTFPEEFELFGGYALAEDLALSFFIHKKMQKKLVNSTRGSFVHYAVEGTRLRPRSMAASRWYNLHLLFDAIYDDVPEWKYIFFRMIFDVFTISTFTGQVFRSGSLDTFRGLLDAQKALSERRPIFRNVKYDK